MAKFTTDKPETPQVAAKELVKMGGIAAFMMFLVHILANLVVDAMMAWPAMLLLGALHSELSSWFWHPSYHATWLLLVGIDFAAKFIKGQLVRLDAELVAKK